MSVTVATLGAVAAVASALLAAGLILAWRALVIRARAASLEAAHCVEATAAATLSSVALLVLGAKLVTISTFAVDLPFWDHWEEAGLYDLFHAGKLSWSAMIGPHNEHRILFSRVLALGLEVANGQWDNRLQSVLCAGVHVLAAIALLTLVVRTGRARELAVLGAAVALVAGLPFARENVGWGFQSQFYLDILFSVLGVGLTLQSTPFSAGWIVGLLCAVLAVMTVGSGGLAVIAIALVTGIDGLRRRIPIGRLVAMLVPIGAGVAFALLLLVRLPSSAWLEAHDVREFMRAFGRSAAWPCVNQPWLGVVMWVPFAGLAWRFCRSRDDRPWERVIMGLGLWALMHAAAIAHARGAGGVGPATRYMDILAVGVVVNAAAGLSLLDASVTLRRRLVGALVAGWSCLALVGGYQIFVPTIALEMPAFTQVSHRQIENVRRFVATDDMAALSDKSGLEIPYPDPKFLAMLLRLPHTRAILPSSVSPSPWQGPLTRLSERVLRWGREFMLAGLMVGVGGALVSIIRRRRSRVKVERKDRATGSVRAPRLPSVDGP
jgi:hypothetical protein